MTVASFEALWSAIPYPAVVLDAGDLIRAANPATESFGAISLRQMERPADPEIPRRDSAVLEVISQARRNGVSVAQYNVMVGWGGQPHRSCRTSMRPLHENDGEVLLLMHPRWHGGQDGPRFSHRSAARSVTGMAAMLAHEIPQPLAGIRARRSF